MYFETGWVIIRPVWKLRNFYRKLLNSDEEESEDSEKEDKDKNNEEEEKEEEGEKKSEEDKDKKKKKKDKKVAFIFLYPLVTYLHSENVKTNITQSRPEPYCRSIV